MRRTLRILAVSMLMVTLLLGTAMSAEAAGWTDTGSPRINRQGKEGTQWTKVSGGPTPLHHTQCRVPHGQ